MQKIRDAPSASDVLKIFSSIQDNNPANAFDEQQLIEQLVWDKFMRNDVLREKLLATGSSKLVHVLNMRDLVDESIEATFWGVFNNKGSNQLGKLLENIRGIIRAKDSVATDTWAKHNFSLMVKDQPIVSIEI